MLHQTYRPLLASVLAVALTAQTASAAVLNDDFNGAAGAAPNATLWSVGATSGHVRLDGASKLAATVTVGGSSQRAVAVTNETGFDPFTAPLMIDLNGIAVGGIPIGNSGTPANVGYVLLGLAETGAVTNHYPHQSGMAHGLGVSIRKYTGDVYELNLMQYSNLSGSGLRINSTFALGGAPSGLTLLVDATSAVKTITMTLEGTTFTDTSLASKTWTLHDDFNATNLSVEGGLVSRIAIGAVNSGNFNASGSGSVFTVDSINIGPVPEPATLGLLGAGLLLVAARPRKR